LFKAEAGGGKAEEEPLSAIAPKWARHTVMSPESIWPLLLPSAASGPPIWPSVLRHTT
jgi:hypothetical protein